MNTAQKVRQMPKGGRKGGSVFPRLALSDAVIYGRKLVSKTHTSAQPKDVILSGVIGAKSGTGEVRMSALKQYGFLKGDTKLNFSAGELAKKIVAAPAEELMPLYRQAVLKPIIFKKLFDTFHGDTVSKAKLKQRAADLKVHPDETASCVELYISSMATAGLVAVEGEQVTHSASSDVAQSAPGATSEAQIEIADEESGEELLSGAEVSLVGNDVSEAARNGGDAERSAMLLASKSAARTGPRAVFNVNVTLDSSLDIEKLQKQLELLKRFGAL